MKKGKEKLSFNRFTLKFDNKQVEEDFRQNSIGNLILFLKIGLFLGMGLYLIFAFFDYLEEESIFRILLINRIVVLSVLILFSFLLYTSFVRKHYYFSVVFLFLTMGLGVLHATYVSSNYISSIYLVIMFFNLIPLLTVRISISINFFLLLVFYFTLTYVSGHQRVNVIQESALLLSGIFITLLAAYTKQITERNNYIKTKKIEEGKTKINLQFSELELTHKKITDSINYAKRIQKALLPSPEKIAELPIDIELFYQPKETIGGDFYWVDEVDDIIVIAIGDCTGHGVPGAIMTSLGINGLINSVTEQRKTNPSEILNYLDDYIDGILSSSDEGYRVKDGMDIGIICINKKLNTLSYSNAGRPLIYIDKGEVFKIKSSRRGIGSKFIATPFITETLTISKTATYYLFSDGLTDQFGGEKNKRLSSKVFNKLLFQWSKLPLSDQRTKLVEFYTEFMKNSRQTDDMVWGAIQIN